MLARPRAAAPPVGEGPASSPSWWWHRWRSWTGSSARRIWSCDRPAPGRRRSTQAGGVCRAGPLGPARSRV